MLTKDMELSVKKLLDDYFSKEQVRDALREIGAPTSRNKDRLARRLRDHWKSHNRDIYELLDFTDIDSLEMICHHYKLDATFKEKDTLKGKMEKANLLVLDKKQAMVIDQNHDSLVPKTKVSSKIDDRKYNSRKPKAKPKVYDRKSKSEKPKATSKDNFQPQEVPFHMGTIYISRNVKMVSG
jgi:hypothetical protein